MTGWWQAALLGFGTGLVLAGIVELGILGVVSRITGQDGQPREPIMVVQIDSETQTVIQPASPDTAANPSELAAVLRELPAALSAAQQAAEHGRRRVTSTLSRAG